MTSTHRCLALASDIQSARDKVDLPAYEAILYNLMAIGEAARHIASEKGGDFPMIPWSSAISLRNVIAHEYFRIRPEKILRTVRQELEPFAHKVAVAAWIGATEGTHDLRAWNRALSVTQSWYWVETDRYLAWIDEHLGTRSCDRESDRLLSVLSDDLETLTKTPWEKIYDAPDSWQDEDSDYHYFNQAPISLGWTIRYEKLWDQFLLIRHNRSSR
ncbi:DUF86 domain-containing protein [Microbacterium sp. NPDC057961]